MNEYISRLAEEATYAMEFTENDLLLETVSNDITYHVPAEFIKKFSELIVKECMEQVWYSREDGINGNVSEVIKERMKQHFGVEE